MKQKDVFRRRIQRFSKDLADRYGFNLHRRTFLTREENNIVQMIVFDFPPLAMQFHVAAQPLYVPCDLLHITFGYRIERCNKAVLGYWGEKEDEIERDLEEISLIVEHEAIPFLQQVSSPKKIISFLEGEYPDYIKFPPILKYKYIAYSYLAIKAYDSSIYPFSEALRSLKEYDSESTNADARTIEYILDLLRKKDYSTIDAFLNEIISNTRKNCGL